MDNDGNMLIIRLLSLFILHYPFTYQENPSLNLIKLGFRFVMVQTAT